MIELTFPDSSIRSFDAGSTGADVALSISKSLAKKAVAIALDGLLYDLARSITADATIEIITKDDPRGLDLLRHDCAHVMAQAVQELYPGTQVTIGPTIENGFFYDFAKSEPFTPEDLPKIEERMRQIIGQDRPFTRETMARDKAIGLFGGLGESYKAEIIEDLPESEEISIYRQGEWYDLCRGPHMPSTGKIGGAFKLMKVAGAYWRGDSSNAMLTRIYGTAWASDADLKAHLTRIEEAERRDHRRLGREMDLFHFQEEGPGVVFWHPNGWTLFRLLIEYMRRRQEEEGYVEVNTPQLLDRALWEASGHWEKYHEHMFVTETEDERVFALKPMNCPGHVQVFKNGLKSYRDLPIKIGEFGSVHRYEPSGALHGLMRVRAFTQDDAHIFCSEDQIMEECLKVHEFMMSIYSDFGFDDVRVKYADRPEQRVGADHLWDKAESALKAVLDESGVEWTHNEGEGAFYGPKLEYVLRDAIGRDWQCGTNQVDLNLPGRLNAFYVDSDSNKQTPVMLHRAMFGSLERFTGILIEHFAGHFPLWLSPVQVVIATITSNADGYAEEVAEMMRASGLRVETDLRNEKINYKIREHSLAKAPIIAVCGQREADERTLNLRRLGSKDQESLSLDAALVMLTDEAMAPDMKRRAKTKAAE